MKHKNFQILESNDPDLESYGRVRRLSSTDADEVIRAVSGDPEKEQKKNKLLSFLPLTAVAIFCIIYVCPIFPSYPTAHTCFAILILGAFLWATDLIPSYTTAYLIPFLSIWFSIGYDNNTGRRIPASQLATRIAAKFMDPIIFVFLGSLTMSEALTKLQITDRLSSFALSKISQKPKVVLFAIMLLNFSTAAFLSNIASTTLLLTFTLPIIRSLSPNDPFIKQLLLGLAWSGNSGGLVTTIASVQNILAIKYINESGAASISFIQWIGFAGPTAFVILILTYFYLRLRYKTSSDELMINSNTDFGKWTWKHTFTCAVTLITIILWAMQEEFPGFFGHVGITALIPVISFFSTKILNSEDFGNFRWSTLSLMGGGIALGEAMNASGLLTLLSNGIANAMKGIPLFVIILIFLLVIGILVSVINHTSAAAILFPVLNQIGLDIGSPILFLTLSAMMVGCAQLFHISSFPTALVYGVQKHEVNNPMKQTNEHFLTGPEFFFAGWPVVLGSALIIASVGYGLVLVMDL
ncbi:Sodium:sulfate symporter transmembrane region family protein [Histomonas meleagridis]|uniref:Sodium:sulfate symporter transmembrane region family protein n=1 Tax=Histomonas meleagridis TaxID=135588 RepID=UPI00355A0A59|nr:Sodium:sulfate symporter transmembrane region family protein [Histomonas meleagridis]KAH0797096.1 Sodium:sulfate symporter transmembrane region family protein [Histomonas meleagridis]